MSDEFDIMKSVQDIVSEAEPLGSVPSCEDPDCPLLLYSPEPFKAWLEHMHSLRPTFTVGLAYPDRSPMARFIRTICPEEFGRISVSLAKDFVVVAKEDGVPGLLGTVIGSAAGTDFENTVADSHGVMVHPIPAWASDYLALLRAKFTVGERISAEAALASLKEVLDAE